MLVHLKLKVRYFCYAHDRKWFFSWKHCLLHKGKYFGQKRPPPRGSGNEFNLEKNREEIQFQRKNKNLTMFMSFMDIFPVFDEFLPYFSSYLSHLMFFTQFHAKYWKIFGASRHLRLYFVQFCVKIENFRRFAPSEALFCQNFCKKRKIFNASRHLKYVMKNFNGTGVKKQGRN